MRRVVGAFAIAVLLAACGGDGNEIAFGQEDSGRTVQAAPGDTLVITLGSNPSTGYTWNQAKAPTGGVLKLVGKTYESLGDAPGSGGTETWRYKALKPGTASFVLQYFRPFEPKNVVRTFMLTVDVSS